ncbi:MAG: hypothetical protein RLZZ558_1501 [Planctomycetota bacterium]|jgi:hypothetical protein
MTSQEPREGGRGAFHPRVSVTAIVLSTVLVAGAVLFGIFGPPVASRLTHGGGVPLSEVLDAAADLRFRVIVDAMSDNDPEPLDPQEARGLIRQHMGASMAPPDLAAADFRLRRVVSVALPGSPYRSCALVYRRNTPGAEAWITLFLAVDDGQYVTFDALGRPRPMPTERTLDGELPGAESLALLWSDGPTLHVACFENAETAEAVGPLLGAP